MVSIVLTCLSAIFISAFALHAAQTCLAPEAIWRAHPVGDPQIAPDGRSVIYMASWNDVMDDLSYGNLRQVSIMGQAITPLLKASTKTAARVGPRMARASHLYQTAAAGRRSTSLYSQPAKS